MPECACGCERPARRKWASDACRRSATRPTPARLRLPFVGVAPAAGTSRSFERAMAVLLLEHDSKQEIVVAWKLSRLVNVWCARLPVKTLRALVDRESRALVDRESRPHVYRPVQYAGYKFDYLPDHFWWVKFGKKSVRIHDVWRFFGTGLESAMDDYGASDLAELMEAFRRGCVSVGVVPDRWEGPGAGASALLNSWEIKEHLATNDGRRIEDD